MADDFPTVGKSAASDEASRSALPLAKRLDFTLGAATVRPSIRTLEGPGGAAAVEPRVMRVLLAFADADGAVLTREDLLRDCWDGAVVGDDSINRAIFELRRLARATDAGFGIETIKRVGYRMTIDEASPGATLRNPPHFSRRSWLGGGLAASLVVAGGFWLAERGGRGGDAARAEQVARLIEEGRRALRVEMPSDTDQGTGYLRQAVAIDPGNASAWGLLALAFRNAAENAPPEQRTAAIESAEEAAERALAIDRREGNALAALATLRPYFGDWIGTDRRLREVLAVAPGNVAAMSHLVTLLQSAGLARESWEWNERASTLDPLSPIHQFRKALKLWIFGRVPESDLTIERALQLWPRHPAVWNARLMTFAFTGRAAAALQMIEDAATRPATLTPVGIDLLRVSLAALDAGTPASIAAARDANLAAAPRSPGFAVNAIMVLSALGEIDAAFQVTDGYMLRRGPLIGSLWTGSGQMPVNDMQWRRTMMLFIPATERMRADRRFIELCEGIGLVDYWRRRGKAPDFPIARAV